MAGNREHLDTAAAGDIIGLYNHGSIQIGDTFTQGKEFQFTGIPNFAAEIFQIVRTRDPLKSKALQKGLIQLSEEGATQVFRPINDNRIILGAVGILQFDVVAHRLQNEYNVDCIYEPINLGAIRWITTNNQAKLKEFKIKLANNIALDASDNLVYLATSMANLHLTIERWPDINFTDTMEVHQ